MTATCPTPRVSRTSPAARTDRRPAADAVLRDIAFALRMARQVSAEIRRDAGRRPAAV